MKIKITETQALRLKLINEVIDPLTKFEEFCQTKVEEINKLFNRITSASFNEIINNEINMTHIYGLLDKIENDVLFNNRKAYEYINTLPEADLDSRIDKATSSVTNKLNAIQIIVMDLEKIQSSVKEHGLLKSFNDIKPIDISNLQ